MTYMIIATVEDWALGRLVSADLSPDYRVSLMNLVDACKSVRRFL